MPGFGRQLVQLFHRTGGEDAAPRHNQGTLGLFQRRRRPGDLPGVAHYRGFVAAHGNGFGVFKVDGLVLDISGDVNHHRAGTAGSRQIKGFLENPGNLAAVLDDVAVFGERLHGAGNVRFLEHVLAQLVAVHLAGNAHQGDGIHVSGGNAGNEVQSTGAGGGDTDLGPSGHPGQAVGAMPSHLLLPNQKMFNGAVQQCVVKGTDGGSGVAEYRLNLFLFQTFHHRLCNRHLHGRLCLLIKILFILDTRQHSLQNRYNSLPSVYQTLYSIPRKNSTSFWKKFILSHLNF